MAGSDRTEWHVMDTATGKLLPDTLAPNRQGVYAWLKDNSGFYYTGYPPAEKGQELKTTTFFQKLYFHKMGTPQSEDYVVYERPDNKEYFSGGEISEDGNWLIITVGKGTESMNMVYFKNLTMEKAPIEQLVTDLKSDYSFLGNDGSTFYFYTDKDASAARSYKEMSATAKSPYGKTSFPNRPTRWAACSLSTTSSSSTISATPTQRSRSMKRAANLSETWNCRASARPAVLAANVRTRRRFTPIRATTPHRPFIVMT